jgi:hypothetical protein
LWSSFARVGPQSGNGSAKGAPPVIRIVFALTVCLGIWHSAGTAVAGTAKDCIAMEETDADDILTYRNDCNRTVIFYYCVIDPEKTEVAPCRRIITGNRRVAMPNAKRPTFLTLEMEPRTPYEVKLWGGSKIKWAACDAELGGLESFTPQGNPALDFSYECNE